MTDQPSCSDFRAHCFGPARSATAVARAKCLCANRLASRMTHPARRCGACASLLGCAVVCERRPLETMRVSFNEILLAFEFVSAAGMGEHEAFLCKQSGQIYWRSELSDDLDELPDDIEDGERYIRIPDKRELDLGKPLVLDFVRQFLPDDFDDVRQIFSRSGAYARFKDLLGRRGALDRWHDFEGKAEEKSIAGMVRSQLDRARRVNGGHGKPACWRRSLLACRGHCRTSIFASLMIFPQRAVSATITAASSAGEFPTGVAPCAANAAFTSGKLSARTTPSLSL